MQGFCKLNLILVWTSEKVSRNVRFFRIFSKDPIGLWRPSGEPSPSELEAELDPEPHPEIRAEPNFNPIPMTKKNVAKTTGFSHIFFLDFFCEPPSAP